MGLVSRFKGARVGANKNRSSRPADDLTDGALDTLSNVIRIMGNESFPLDGENDSDVFPKVCTDFACHVENGAAVPTHDLPASADGKREWARVRRFFADRRHAEKAFVTERLHGYRGIVDDLVGGLRSVGMKNQSTEDSVLDSLLSIEDAVDTGALPDIEAALAKTVTTVNETFAEQKREYEKQLAELNGRMSNLQQDLAAAREEMKRDSLTEAYNRGAFNTAISQSLNLHFVTRQPITLLMIDVDCFKEVNDTYGHAAGDEALKAIGECLARSFIRKNDLVARYGGDEFAVILTDTSAQNATGVIERFLEYVRSIDIDIGRSTVRVSCSVGYTEITAEDSVGSFVERADQALYQAKSKGRDQSALIDAGNAKKRG